MVKLWPVVECLVFKPWPERQTILFAIQIIAKVSEYIKLIYRVIGALDKLIYYLRKQGAFILTQITQ